MQENELYHALLDPACYPERPRRVFARDTHISRLYFTPHFVYKLKKHVNFGFLDFTSLDRRRFFCDEEKRLNQNHAPDTYLGTVAIRATGKQVKVATEQGAIVDYAVKMRRLPQSRMLDRLIRRKSPHLEDEFKRLVPVLTDLFQTSLSVTDLSAEELFHRLTFNCQENLAQTEPFCKQLLAREAWQQMHDYTHAALSDSGLKAKFIQRARDGLIHEGHGDLHSEHICMTEPVRIYDCIEFNQRFRTNDLLSEMAFLLMDLDYRGCHKHAMEILEGCCNHLHGLNDPVILQFFLAYRAWVRGKVAALTSRDLHLSNRARSAAVRTGQRHFCQALGYLCKPFLVITCGLMGSGKSTLAGTLARACNATLIRSDHIRKSEQGIPPSQHEYSGYGQGLYASTVTQQTYSRMLKETEKALKQEGSVVVDASFNNSTQRETFEQLARRLGVPFLTLWLDTPKSTLINRLTTRSVRGHDISDGRAELLDAQQADFAPPKDNEIIEKIDSSLEVDYNVQLVLSRILIDHGWQP